jgi:uncharacterized membrane protein YccC
MAKEIVNENPCTPDTNTADAIGKVEPEQVNAQANEKKLAYLQKEFERVGIDSPLNLCNERSMPEEIDIAEEVRRLADRLCELTRDTNYFTRVKSYHDEIYKQNLEAERRICANLENVVCVRISNLVHLLYAKNCEKFPELAPKVQQEQPKAPAADGKPEDMTRFNPKKDGRVCN